MLGPHIVLLNGVSNSGKTSIAKALQGKLDAPYLHVCIDTFEEMMPAPRSKQGDFGWQPIFNNMLSGFHHSIRALADCGNNLIVDHVLVEGEEPLTWVSECLSLLTVFDVFLVGVRCALVDLEQREVARGNRPVGLARWQFERMHRQVVYDLQVDTAAYSPEECASQIMAALSGTARSGLSKTLHAVRSDSFGSVKPDLPA